MGRGSRRRRSARRRVALAALLATTLGSGGLRHADAAPAALRRPAVEVFGDRYGSLLAFGLSEIDGAVSVVTSTTDVAGISGPGYGEWLRSLRDRLARPTRPDVAVMMVGEHDHGPLVEGGTRLDPGTPAWVAAYGARVDAVARLFGDAHVSLVWVGLPPVRSQDGSADASRIDGLLRDRGGGARRPRGGPGGGGGGAPPDGVRCVDIWRGCVDTRAATAPTDPMPRAMPRASGGPTASPRPGCASSRPTFLPRSTA